MELTEIIAIALALSVDAFAVAVATGVSLKKINLRNNFRMAWHFGLFQALMPACGWYVGYFIHNWVESYDHWIAFFMLVFVAQGMVRGPFQEKADKEKIKDPTKGISLIILSIATSIDALAIGLSLSMLKVSIWIPALIIGIITCFITAGGMYLGKYFRIAGNKLSSYAEIAGGLILIIIGINILREHGVFNFHV